MDQDQPTPAEELANSLTHGIGLLGAVAVTPALVINAIRHGSAMDIVGAAVFGATLILLYLASTVYHGTPPGRTKDFLQKVDHAAIYLLIAGTYTPFTLGVLRGGWGWTLLGVVWGGALLGVMVKVSRGVGHAKLGAALYLLMGWLVIVAARPLVMSMPVEGLGLLALGGLLYTGGVYFYLRDGRYSHAIWHLFVLGGSASHVVAVLLYAR
jgi:hemolysin III